ncbi:MAG: ParB/RepB/Spo0J family partition protein [Clostridia bacterium]
MNNDKPVSAGQVLLIPNERIYPNPHQPRRVFDQGELVNLAISIRMNGILQPITVRETVKGYEVVSGERRLRASRLAGMIVVPCIVIEVNEFKSAVFSLIENIQRQNLGYFEEALGIENLLYEFGISQDEAAKKLGKAPSTVSNKLRLLNLPKKAQKLLVENSLSERHARALLRLKDEQVMFVLEKVIEKKLNIVQTEKLVEDVLSEVGDSKRNTRRMFSDVKIFIKTIDGAVKTMKNAGIKASVKRVDRQDCYVYEIEIPKSEVYACNRENK